MIRTLSTEAERLTARRIVNVALDIGATVPEAYAIATDWTRADAALAAADMGAHFTAAQAFHGAAADLAARTGKDIRQAAIFGA